MRSSLIVSMTLACGALLCSFSASAIPIKVGLTGAAGEHSWRSPGIGDPSYLNLSAWQYDNGEWVAAYMDLAQDKQGLGVCAQTPTDGDTTCPAAVDSTQIDSVPWQVIDMNITEFIDWNGATITLLSVDPGFSGSLFGASCGAGTAGCQPGSQALASCKNVSTTPIPCQFTLSDSALRGITDIWITPSARDPNGESQGNMLLSVDFYLDTLPVPEPAEWGVFGFGLLLVGLFAGLRRRRRVH